MNNQYFYQPQVIYTRLKDVFNNETNKDNEDFSPSNFIKPITIKKAMEEKELVECWIEAIKSSN